MILFINALKCQSVTPSLMKLPLTQYIIQKLNLIVFKALGGDAPDYIQLSVLTKNKNFLLVKCVT